MKQRIFSSILTMLVCATTYAQDSTLVKAFVPEGKAIVRVFGNYNAGLGSANEVSGFDLTRAYLGYNYTLAKGWSAKAILDAAVPASGTATKRDLYLKNAFLKWSSNRFNLNMGLIGLLQFNTQEQFWGYRYVAATFQDMYGMNSSADLGLTIDYQLTNCLKADVSITNGEGYKNINRNNTYRYGFGLTATPIKALILRAYTDLYGDSENIRGGIPSNTSLGFKDQYSLSLFAGYKQPSYSLGAEYNYQGNKKFVDGCDYYGYSLFGTMRLNKQFALFARYDKVDSATPTGFTPGWNSSDGQMVLAGLEYQPIKEIKIAPNFRNENPAFDTSKQYFYINVLLDL